MARTKPGMLALRGPKTSAPRVRTASIKSISACQVVVKNRALSGLKDDCSMDKPSRESSRPVPISCGCMTTKGARDVGLGWALRGRNWPRRLSCLE